ncbi:GAF domain-containing protein [Ligilactobacillus saerimneri]|uniref:GAF domain-containing protein n=1 Tax=Ligilactobacillus saerimneri TaxID=228229 RepID=UPI002942A5DE|nr:GAF domain-containing protein [Ligilactobacillus saerimneri]
MKAADYQLLLEQTQALLAGETDWVAKTANLSALLYEQLNDVNFAGFYRYENDELILGPFQGKVACVHIQMGKGVCGTAAACRETIVVPNVHEFAGHIACDSASNSEIVVPIYRHGQLWGVLDIDSPKLSNFDEVDAQHLEQICAEIFK